MPKYQVIRFQIIAPSKAAIITICVISFGFTMPLPTVWATFTLMKAPAKFKEADITTASLIVITLVDTTQAMALALS